MAKVRTTVTLDERVLRSVKVRAAREGKGDSQVIEDALRRELGIDLLERIWAKSDVSEPAAMRLGASVTSRRACPARASLDRRLTRAHRVAEPAR